MEGVFTSKCSLHSHDEHHYQRCTEQIEVVKIVKGILSGCC